MAGHRQNRVSEDIKREIVAVMRELKDPRIQGMLTVVRVDVTTDLSYAKVYVSAMEGIETAKLAVKGLTSASGYIRREVGGKLRLRKAPELKFIADDSVQHGMDIMRKLGSLTSENNGESEDEN